MFLVSSGTTRKPFWVHAQDMAMKDAIRLPISPQYGLATTRIPNIIGITIVCYICCLLTNAGFI